MQNNIVVTKVCAETLINKDRDVQIWDRGKWNGSYYRMPYLITAEEGAELFSLPVGSHEINAGLSVDTSALKKKSYGESVINSAELPIGTVKSSDKKDVIGINLGDLTKHMLVVGTPGSGKTTFLVGMLDRLWKEYQIPFLVIEPAKNEYRAMEWRNENTVILIEYGRVRSQIIHHNFGKVATVMPVVCRPVS